MRTGSRAPCGGRRAAHRNASSKVAYTTKRDTTRFLMAFAVTCPLTLVVRPASEKIHDDAVALKALVWDAESALGPTGHEALRFRFADSVPPSPTEWMATA